MILSLHPPPSSPRHRVSVQSEPEGKSSTASFISCGLHPGFTGGFSCYSLLCCSSGGAESNSTKIKLHRLLQPSKLSKQSHVQFVQYTTCPGSTRSQKKDKRKTSTHSSDFNLSLFRTFGYSAITGQRSWLIVQSIHQWPGRQTDWLLARLKTRSSVCGLSSSVVPTWLFYCEL